MDDVGLAWDEAGLEQRCTDLRGALSESGLAASAELASYWPGGAENDEEGLGAWIYCYASYVRMLGRMDEQRTEAKAAEAEQAVLAALREEPGLVELVRPLEPDGSPYLTIYPKSFEALCHLEARDRELGRLGVALDYLQQAPDSEVAERVRTVYEEIGYQTRVIVWALTTEGPGLPFPPEAARPEPPAWTTRLDAGDILQALRTHQHVNGRRIDLIGILLGAAPGPKRRGSWTVLGATASSELGVSTRTLLRDRSLAAWLAQITLTADAKAQALDDVRRRHG